VKYPERLLIYNAGMGRTVFIGSLKVTTIFVFGFFSLVVAPGYYYTPDAPAGIASLGMLIDSPVNIYSKSLKIPHDIYALPMQMYELFSNLHFLSEPFNLVLYSEPPSGPSICCNLLQSFSLASYP
jgi:hypothetical protein